LSEPQEIERRDHATDERVLSDNRCAVNLFLDEQAVDVEQARLRREGDDVALHQVARADEWFI
jgi:hypothetical protein